MNFDELPVCGTLLPVYENFLIPLQFLFCDRQARLKDDSMVLLLLRLSIVGEVC